MKIRAWNRIVNIKYFKIPQSVIPNITCPFVSIVTIIIACYFITFIIFKCDIHSWIVILLWNKRENRISKFMPTIVIICKDNGGTLKQTLFKLFNFFQVNFLLLDNLKCILVISVCGMCFFHGETSRKCGAWRVARVEWKIDNEMAWHYYTY